MSVNYNESERDTYVHKRLRFVCSQELNSKLSGWTIYIIYQTAKPYN